MPLYDPDFINVSQAACAPPPPVGVQGSCQRRQPSSKAKQAAPPHPPATPALNVITGPRKMQCPSSTAH